MNPCAAASRTALRSCSARLLTRCRPSWRGHLIRQNWRDTGGKTRTFVTKFAPFAAGYRLPATAVPWRASGRREIKNGPSQGKDRVGSQPTSVKKPISGSGRLYHVAPVAGRMPARPCERRPGLTLLEHRPPFTARQASLPVQVLPDRISS